MELRHLRYFVAVAEERHFGHAAERLHIAQPPLSQQIRRLEAELGEPLLYRTTRSVELAPAGEVLLERGREILAAVDSAVEDARRAARGEYGRLAIGFTGSCTYAMLPALAAALGRALPGVVLDLQGELLTPAQVARLVDGTLDLGLLRPPVNERALSTEVLRSEPLLAVLPESHRLASSEAIPLELLEGEPFITYPSHFRSVVHDAVEDACAAHGFKPTGRSRGGRDLDARELRGGGPRRLARPGVGAQHDDRRARCTARSCGTPRGSSSRWRGGVTTTGPSSSARSR